jgi:integrase
MENEQQYPEGTKFNRWVIVQEKDGDRSIPRVRRWVIYPDGKKVYERYAVKKYAHLRGNLKELQNFVIRLNGEDPAERRAKLAIKFKHAYISPELLNEYLEHVLTQVPSRKHALNEFSNIQRYFFGFFIVKMNMADPLKWHRHQNVWAKALLNKIDGDDIFFEEKWRLFPKDEVRGEKTLRAIVNGANRFMAFLHQRRPDEVPPLRFNPITRAGYKELEARRRMNGETVDRKFIKDEDWKIISKEMPEDIAPWIWLSYYYGLRRSESMAIDPTCIRKDCLKAVRQLTSLPEPHRPGYGPLKGRKERRIPHWFCEPMIAYNWVSKIGPLMHPDTFSKRWTEYMSKLGFDYDIHDIRHTWTTKAIRLKEVVPRDVQLAAGHESIETTMGYLHDDRVFGDEVFNPGSVIPMKKTG